LDPASKKQGFGRCDTAGMVDAEVQRNTNDNGDLLL
jgi:hypothetical protein